MKAALLAVLVLVALLSGALPALTTAALMAAYDTARRN